MIPSNWGDPQINILTRMWEDGYTANAIAQEFADRGYAFTRNAVIGKIHRMGLTRNPLKDPPKRTPRRKIKRTNTSTVVEGNILVNRRVVNSRRSLGVTVKEPSSSSNILLTKTKNGECRAIIGYQDNLLAQAVCCGAETVWVLNKGKLTQSSWCEFHRSIYVDTVRSSK